MATLTQGLRNSKRRGGRSLPIALATALVAISAAAGPDIALAQSDITGRPILFVNGFCGGRDYVTDESQWEPVANDLAASLRNERPDLYPSADISDIIVREGTVRLWETWDVVSVATVPTSQRFFVLNFSDWSGAFRLNQARVAEYSVLNKAYELATAIRAVTTATRSDKVIVVGHSMGGLVARAYIQGLASATVLELEGTVYRGRNGTPSFLPYRGDIAQLITLDTPHGGSNLAALSLPTSLPPCFAEDTLNRRELRPWSEVLSALNFQEGLTVAGHSSTVQARPFPPDLSISPVISVGSPDYLSDGIVSSVSQAMLVHLPVPKHPQLVFTTTNRFSAVHMALCVGRLSLLHTIGCLAISDSTRATLLRNALRDTSGHTTTIAVRATLDGNQWNGPVTALLAGDQAESVYSPTVLHSRPLGSYQLRYISGGPTGSAPVRISPSPVQSLSHDNWSVTFDMEFETTATAAPPAPVPTFGYEVAPGTVLTSMTPTLTWRPIAGADSYDVQVLQYPQLTPRVRQTVAAPASELRVTAGALMEGWAHSWSVRAHTATGWSAWSSPRYFSTPFTTPTPAFSVELQPQNAVVEAGKSVTMSVVTGVLTPPAATITLGLTNLPSGVTASIGRTTLTAGESTTLTLSAAASTTPGPYAAMLTATGPPAAARVVSVGVTVTSASVGAPAACLSPGALQFSPQAVYTNSAPQTVTLRNCGTGSLRIDRLIGAPDFHWSTTQAFPLDLPRDASMSFQVLFVPQGDGMRTGSVSVYTNAPNSPVVVSATGSGLAAPVTTGNIVYDATVNGVPYSGTLLFQRTYAGLTVNRGTVPTTETSVSLGTYSVAFTGSPPAGSTLSSVTPAASQTLTAGQTIKFTFNFVGPNHFALLQPSTPLVVAPGGQSSLALTVARVTGISQSITMSATGLPAGVRIDYGPQTVSLGNVASVSTTLTATVDATTLPGVYPVGLVGVNQDGVRRTTTLLLVVRPPVALSAVTRTPGGAFGNGEASDTRPGLSADGRLVAFTSAASDLVANDLNGERDVFVRDLTTQVTTRVNVGIGGAEADGQSYGVSLSGDGRFVAFDSDAGNLVVGAPRSGYARVYVHDRVAGTTEVVSVSSDGVVADGWNASPSITGDGRFVVFTSSATNLDARATSGVGGSTYLHDRQTGTTTLESVGTTGEVLRTSTPSAVTLDGRFVAFTASWTTPGTTNATRQVYLRDRVAHTTRVVSVPDGVDPNGSVWDFSMTADGRFIAFRSAAENLVADDGHAGQDVFLFERLTGRLSIVPGFRRQPDAPVSQGLDYPALSGDGRFLAATMVIATGQALVHDLHTGATAILSTGSGGALGDRYSGPSSISEDGRRIVFRSAATMLAPGDANGVDDLFTVVNPLSPAVGVASLAISPASVVGGALAEGTVILSGPAPTGGVSVAIASADDNVVLPPAVVVPAGGLSGRFLIGTRPVTFTARTVVTASYSGSRSTVLEVRAPAAKSITALGGGVAAIGGSASTAARFTVLVRDDAGNPVAGVPVTFAAQEGASTGTFSGGGLAGGALSAADGTAVSPVFSPGLGSAEYLVTASAPGLLTAAAILVKQAGAPVQPTLLIDVSPAGVSNLDAGQTATFTVTVTNGLGQAVPGAAVTVTHPLSGALAVTADGAGLATYTATLEQAGTYEIRFGPARLAGHLDSGELLRTVVVREAPPAVFRRYLAEGATSGFFSLRLALLNPGGATSNALLTFSKADGSTNTRPVVIPARTRVSIDPKTIAGLDVAEFSTAVESDQVLVVERTMWWDASGYGAHGETASAAPAMTWYLAEGATHGTFNLFYLLQNPNTQPAEVRVRYLRPSGVPLEKTYTLAASSRTNIWVDYEEFAGLGRALASTDVSAVVEVTNAQPIIVERAMYADVPGQTYGAGHNSAGITAPAPEWFLAEGATGPYFDLFILIANPTATTAQVEVTYLLPDGSTLVKAHQVGANSRFNIWVDHEDARLADTAVSATVRSMSGVPLIVERAMWWPGGPATWHEAHNSAGATTTGTQWALAEGEVDASRNLETYILVANTSPTPADVLVTLLFEDGTQSERTFTGIPGRSRFNVPVGHAFPAAAGRRFGAILESVGPTPAQIVVERAVYWDVAGQRWAAGTNALATKLR